MPAPSWSSLLSPLPTEATAQRKPVASAAQLEEGTAGPIAGWQSVTVNLSEPEYHYDTCRSRSMSTASFSPQAIT